MGALDFYNEYQRIEPFAHQRRHLDNHVFRPSWGLLWEQGTAKTKPTIDTAAILYLSEEINGMIILAPSGVDYVWVKDELPKHLPDVVAQETQVLLWRTARQHTKIQEQRVRALLAYKGFSVLVMTYHAIMVKKGKKVVWDFFTARKGGVLYVLDEAHAIKNPNAKRTKTIIASSKYAKYRRILTGTPIAVGPFDLYAQVRFLDNGFWKRQGIAGAVEFRNYFGEWFTRQECMAQYGYDPKFNRLLGYRNLEELKGYLDMITDRVLKEDVLDLPPKLYSKVYVEMTKEQKHLYDTLTEEYVVEWEDGRVIDGALAIVRLLRFQQILCNYIPVEEGDPIRVIDGANPRITALQEIINQTHNPGIIYARFRNDVDQIMDLFDDDEAVRYDGSLSEEQAYTNRKRFEDCEVNWFVATIAKGGPGLTLHRAKTVIYFSNSFKMVDRLQSEDRAHRAGMDSDPVHYIDITCANSVDEDIVENLQRKHEIASHTLGDRLKKWLAR